MADTARQLTITAVFKDLISGNLEKVNKGWERFNTQVKRASASLAPLTGQATQLLSLVASTAAFSKALAAAEAQAKAEARLANALGENVAQLERIIELTGKIQGKSLFGDEVLAEQAATLVGMGTSIGNIDRALQVAVDTSAALGLELETVTRSIGLFQTGTAGRLGQRIPFLQKMIEDGTLASKGIEELEKVFGGAAERISKTPFGQFRQNLNLIDDQFERFGDVLVGPVNTALKVLIASLTDFMDFVTQFKNNPLLLSLTEIGTKAVVATAALIGMGLAGKGLVFAFSTLVTVLTPLTGLLALLFTPAGAILAGVLALAAGIAIATTDTEDWSDALASVSKDVSLINDGFVDTPTLIESATASFTQFSLTVARAQISVFSKLRTSVTDFRVLLLEFFTFVAKRLSVVLISVAATADKITGLLGDALDKVGADGSKVRTNLVASAIGFSVTLVEDFASEMRELEAFSAQVKDSTEAINKAIVKVSENTDTLNQKNATERANARTSAEQAITDARRLNAERAENLRLLQEESAIRQLNKVRDGNSPDILEASRQIQLEALERQLEKNQISLQKFFAEKRKLENEAFDLREANIRKELEQVREGIIRENLTRAFAKKGEATAVTDISGLIRQQADLEEQINKIQLERAKTNANLTESERDKIDAVRKELQQTLNNLNARVFEVQRAGDEALLIRQRAEVDDLTARLTTLGATIEEREQALGSLAAIQKNELRESLVAQAQDLAQKVTDAEGRYRRAISETNDALAARIINETQAREVASIALDDVIAKSEEATAAIQALAVKYPEFAAQIVLALEQVRGAVGKVQEEASGLGFTFTDGINKGIEDFKAKATDAFTQGRQLVGDFVDIIGNNLSTAISDAISGTKSLSDAFRTFAADTLQQIARIIVQLLVMRAIKSAFGGFGFNEGGPVLGFAGGGHVPGRGPNRDTVDAKLTRGEYVFDRDTVDHYGVAVMRAIHRRLIPPDLLAGFSAAGRYTSPGFLNDGGSVEGGASSQSSGGAIAAVVASEQGMETLLAGGSGAMLRFLQDHKGQF